MFRRFLIWLFALSVLAQDRKETAEPGLRLDNYVYRLVEFKQLPTDEERHRWQQEGFILTDYYPKNKYFAVIRKDLIKTIQHIEKIQRITEVPIEIRVHPALLTGQYPSYALKGDSIKVAIVYYKVFRESDILAEVEKLGLRRTISDPFGYTMEGFIPLSNVKGLIRLPFLQYIDLGSPPPQPENSYYVGGITGAIYVQSLDTEYNAEGIRVMVGEGQVGNIPALAGRLIVLNPSDPVSNHATNVAWHMAGAPIENVSVRNNA